MLDHEAYKKKRQTKLSLNFQFDWSEAEKQGDPSKYRASDISCSRGAAKSHKIHKNWVLAMMLKALPWDRFISGAYCC